MSVTKVESSGRFGTAFLAGLEKQNLTLVEFAKVMDGNYEHFRKILKGQMFPTKHLMAAMCKVLKLDLAQAEVLVAQDRMEKKLGKRAFNAASGRSAHASEFDALIPHLTESQVQQILAQMKTMLKHKG